MSCFENKSLPILPATDDCLLVTHLSHFSCISHHTRHIRVASQDYHFSTMKLLCWALVLLHLFELSTAKDGHIRLRGLQESTINWLSGITDSSGLRLANKSSSKDDDKGNRPNSACCNEDPKRPTSLTFRLTGKSCANGTSGIDSQEENKSKCKQFGDQADFPEGVYLVSASSNGDEILDNESVTLNDTFDVTPPKGFDTESFLILKDINGNVLQWIEYHTSCSQPLNIFDDWGAFQLVNYRYARGSKCMYYFILFCTFVF